MRSTLRSTMSWCLIIAMVLSLSAIAVLMMPQKARAQTAPPWTVTTTVDTPGAVPPNEGELRWAITEANAWGLGPGEIDFQVENVYLNAELPPLTNNDIEIDGMYNDEPVDIYQWGGGPYSGLIVESWSNEIHDIVFHDFGNHGVWIRTVTGSNWASSNSVEDVTVQNCGKSGIKVSCDSADMGANANWNYISDCVVEWGGWDAAGPAGTSTDEYGIMAICDDGQIEELDIENCTVYGFGDFGSGFGGGIGMFDVDDSEVSGCLIGTQDALSMNSNAADGIALGEGCEYNEFGVDNQRNFIVGNDRHGIYVNGCDNNEFKQNSIGVGSGPFYPEIGNVEWGIVLEGGCDGNWIGQDNPLAPSRIGYNGEGGIYLNGVTNTTIQGNGIGTGFIGPFLDWGNGGDGIRVELSSNTTIGADDPSSFPFAYNTIGHNEGNGISIRGDSPTNGIYINSIFDNNDDGDPDNTIGINLIDDAVPESYGVNTPQGPGTLFDYPDSDEPNEWMNFPVIDSAARRPDGDVQASGTAYPGSRVFLYYADDDPSGYGQGETYLGTVDADPGDGSWTFSGEQLDPDELLTATALDMTTDPPGYFMNSSEFAANYTVGDDIPPEGSIGIDGGAPATGSLDVTLNLNATDDYYAPSALDYQVSNYADFHDAAWQDVPAGGVWNEGWTLEAGPDGDRTVYYRVQNPWQTSEDYSDTIRLKTDKPTGSVTINNGAPVTGNPAVELEKTLNDSYYTPEQCDMQVSNSSDFSGAVWQNYEAVSDWNLTGGTGWKRVYTRYRDPVGNTSNTYNDTIFLDQSGPTGSVLINGGAASTDTQEVTLTIDVDDTYYDPEDCMMQVSNYDNYSGAAWQDYQGTLDWTLLPVNGNKTVYTRFKDPLGNTSGSYTATIELRSGEPLGSATWYLAEGTSAWGFNCYLTVINPNDREVTAGVTYMTDTGEVPGPDMTLPADSQTSFSPSNTLGEEDFSTKVVCKEGLKIAVDRTMYWTGEGAPSPDGHCSIGVTAPADTWYLAEGCSGFGFETWLLVQNPNNQDADCTITYMIEGEGPVTFDRTVPAGCRCTYNMEDDIGQKNASIMVESDIPVIPERSMYRNNRREGHDSIGAKEPATDFFLAEGTTAWGFTTWVLVQNPNDEPASVTVTYMTPEGPAVQEPFEMPANSRETIKVNDVLSNTDLSTKVHADKPIIAERSMFWGEGTALGEACHTSVGIDGPQRAWYLPDGQTSDGRETYTLVQNPNDSDVVVEITYMTPDGQGNVTFEDTIPANSRKTYNMADEGINGRAAIEVISKTEGKKIIVERAMYWNDRGAGTDTIGGCAN